MTQNILLIAPQPFYQDRGTPIAIKELCYALESLDVEITLLCLLEGEDIPLPRNVILKRATYPKFLFNLKPGFSWKKVLVDLYLIKEASKLIQQNNYDLLVAVEEAAIFSAIFFGNRIPLLVDMDSDITEQMTNANGFWKPFKPVLDVIYSIPFSKCISVKAVCKELCYTAIRLGAKQCYLLEDCAETFREPNFIDPDLKRMLEGHKIILYVGNFEKYQGIEMLLKSILVLREQASFPFKLILIGGAFSKIIYYRKLAESLGISNLTIFAGPKKSHELAQYFSLADCLVSPRICGVNTPMKIYTYLSVGKPIVATDILSHTQVLDRYTSFLANPDPDSYARAILEALTSCEATQKANLAMLRFHEHYNKQAFAKKAGIIFKEVLSMIKSFKNCGA